MAKTRLFADDCVIYRPIKNSKDCLQLQDDLYRLAEWEDKGGMCFKKNAVSSEILEQDQQFCTPYTLKGQILHTDEQITKMIPGILS